MIDWIAAGLFVFLLAMMAFLRFRWERHLLHFEPRSTKRWRKIKVVFVRSKI